MVTNDDAETDLLESPGVVAQDEPAPAPSAMDAAIDLWFVERIHNSPVSRDTTAFNHISASVADLKSRLKGI